jgi:prolyl oligopeptidase
MVEVIDELHGVRVADPYRWLEDGDVVEVGRWVTEQNHHTATLLGSRPGRRRTRERLTDLLSIGSIGTPIRRGGRTFYRRREGSGQNQPVLYVRDGLNGEDRALLDPNQMNADGTSAIDWWYPSEDGAYMAFGISEGGDEKSTLRVLDVTSGRALPDTIPHTRYCSLAWLPDRSGFFYTRYPAPGEVPEGEENYHRHLFFHRLGEDPGRDRKIFGDGRDPREMLQIAGSPDGGYLVIMAFVGWSRSDLYVKDLGSVGSPCLPIAEGIDAVFRGEIVGRTLYLLTNWRAPRYRLLAVDLTRPGNDQWKTLIPEGESVLEEVAVTRGRLVAHAIRDASSRITLHEKDGRLIREIELPCLGSVERLSARYDHEDLFFGFSSFTVPPTIYRLNLKTGDPAVWESISAGVDLPAFEVEQHFFRSADGTRIPMFLVHRRGLRRDGDNPTLLTGYGGFNINLTPAFSRGLVLWLERGGVYAQANLRGGGEYGEEWHRAGMRERKQNVFDDFAAAADWLIRKNYTRADRLAIRGGSNGGLLAGAAITQRPQLFRAAIIGVPLLDMLRYHHFRIAGLWVPEYGSAASAEEFRWLYAYSPYHRVVRGTPYPAVLLNTAEGDSRVDPMHARKMAARLQEATTSGRPILLRTSVRAGHGAGKPLAMMIDEATDDWTFLLWQLDMEGARPHARTGGAPRPGPPRRRSRRVSRRIRRSGAARCS